VVSFCFLDSTITQDFRWELNISSIAKKAQQRMFLLGQRKKFNLPKTMMVHFYAAIMESILCSSISAWYAAATSEDQGRLQRIIGSAERRIEYAKTLIVFFWLPGRTYRSYHSVSTTHLYISVQLRIYTDAPV